MSFKPQGVNVFAKASGKQEFKPNPTDTLFEVVEYKDKGVMVAKRVSDGKLIDLSVSGEAIARNRKFETNNKSATWFGHLIDARMAAEIPVGNKFVAERAVFVCKQKGGNDIFECSRIINLTDQSDEKIVTGIITVSGWDGRVRGVQVWDPESVLISDEKSIHAIAAEFDNIAKERAEGRHPVGQGVQFRVCWAGQVIEVSSCIDYFPAVKDEEGNEIEPGRSPTSDDFLKLVAGFDEYAKQKFEGHVVQLEVCRYRSHIASTMSKSMEVNEYSAGFQMMNAQSKLSKEDPDAIQQGKNMAVKGIVSLTADAVDRKSKTFIKRDMANKVFLNGVRGNVNSFVRSPGGEKVKFADDLKIFKAREEKPTEAPAEKPLDSVDQKLATVAPAVVAKVEASMMSDDFWAEVDADPFGDASK